MWAGWFFKPTGIGVFDVVDRRHAFLVVQRPDLIDTIDVVDAIGVVDAIDAIDVVDVLSIDFTRSLSYNAQSSHLMSCCCHLRTVLLFAGGRGRLQEQLQDSGL